MMTRLLVILCTIFIFSCQEEVVDSKIDRYELVNRHNIKHNTVDSLSSLTVGNGEFAFTADITGMQTFPQYYEKGIPLGTQSQWGWHSFSNEGNYSFDDVYKNYWNGTDSVAYLYQYGKGEPRQVAATKWLRENPHRLHLGLIGLEIKGVFDYSKIQNPVQELNLWTGELKSRFEVDGVPVEVVTYVHQDKDMVTFSIKSDLFLEEKMQIKLEFPYAHHEKFSSGHDIEHPKLHSTEIVAQNENGVTFKRQLDADGYFNQINWSGKAELIQDDYQGFLIYPSKDRNEIEFSSYFSESPSEEVLPDFQMTKANNEEIWKAFWETGAAIDFSDCTDPRANELERRVILSQYLTKIQCTGAYPPQETGLTFNSWHGKFHMEMHWWHALHFILWDRGDLVDQQLDYYYDIFDVSRQTAELQGYEGVRWPKMVDPSGRESPSSIGTFLIWQQPNIIYLTEMLFRQNQDVEVLNKYKKLVFATADFMASYARLDSIKNEYVLGPALIPAQERFHPETTINPSFELAYWHWGLRTALDWQERLGIEKTKKWQDVLDRLAPLPVKDGLYLFTEDATDSYDHEVYLTDHPIVLGILGFVPESEKVDKEIMRNTQKKIVDIWQWETTWGWDMPLAAMNAMALDQPEKAIDFLLMETPKNTYLMNGHNYQDATLTIYLPGNGGLLSAIAMMCDEANGFPKDGNWEVKVEGFD